MKQLMHDTIGAITAAVTISAIYLGAWLAGLLAQLLALRVPRGRLSAPGRWVVDREGGWPEAVAAGSQRYLLALAAVVGLTALVGWRVGVTWNTLRAVRMAKRTTRGHDGNALRGARWATLAEALRHGALTKRPQAEDIVVGVLREDNRDVRRSSRANRHFVKAPDDQHVAIIGHTRSGKTFTVGQPTLLRWPGPAVVTSTKPDLAQATMGFRASLGPILIFDPAGVMSAPPARFHPATGCTTWLDLEAAMAGMVGAHLRANGRLDAGEAAHWYEEGVAVGAALLALSLVRGADMHVVAEWADRLSPAGLETVAQHLQSEWPDPQAAAVLTALAKDDERHRANVMATVREILRPWRRVPPIKPSAALDIRALVGHGEAFTLYLLPPPGESPNSFGGIIGGAVEAVWRAAALQAARSPSGRLDSSLLFLLDEVANVAPLPSLRAVATTGLGLGVRAVTLWQTVGQVGRAYGPEAEEILGNHGTHAYMGGTPDLDTARWVEERCGSQRTTDRIADSTTTVLDTDVRGGTAPLLPASEFQSWPRHEALALVAGLRPLRVRTAAPDDQPDTAGRSGMALSLPAGELTARSTAIPGTFCSPVVQEPPARFPPRPVDTDR